MADLEETGVYDLTCPSSHRTAFCLQNFKFELLFDLGLQAIDDGYYREAVSSFASALERFQFERPEALVSHRTSRRREGGQEQKAKHGLTHEPGTHGRKLYVPTADISIAPTH